MNFQINVIIISAPTAHSIKEYCFSSLGPQVEDFGEHEIAFGAFINANHFQFVQPMASSC
jgi:hypothetical protein